MEREARREGKITGWSDYVQEESPRRNPMRKEEGNKIKND